MKNEVLPLDLARQVTPRSLTNYVSALNWPRVEGINGHISVFHRPDSPLHQVVIPLDESFSDYPESVTEAIYKLADYENRSAQEVLEHLLLPPADMLTFREVSPDAESGSLPFDHAVRMINGTRKLLLSVAHSVLVPRAYHPRLSRSEAEEFVNRCRLGQTQRGSFALNVACPLELPVSLSGLQSDPFARQVTTLLLQSLGALAKVADSKIGDDLLDSSKYPGISANLCESLLLLRPNGDRGRIIVSATWSRAFLPSSKEPSQQVELYQQVFELAEAVAPRLRTIPQPRLSEFIGYVDALRGQSIHQDPRPSGEVDFTIFDFEEGEIHARGTLNANDYAKAGKAHLESELVSFRGILRRLPQMSRVEQITEFEIVKMSHPYPYSVSE
jgi:hypothetical protein